MQGRTELFGLMRDLVWDREGWYIPLEAALQGLTAGEAAWQPPGGGNTIWQTLNHLNYWNAFMLARLTGRPGDTLIENDETFGAAGDPDDEEGWQVAVGRARQLAQELRAAVASLSEADLDRPLKDMGTVASSLAAWTLHDAYHTGQIVLIRRMQGSWPAGA